jgi:hypothetical protein
LQLLQEALLVHLDLLTSQGHNAEAPPNSGGEVSIAIIVCSQEENLRM